MSLNWHVSEVVNKDTVCFREVDEGDGKKVRAIRPATERLIWATMAVGISEIKPTNVSEFHKRLKFWSTLRGMNAVKYETVRKHIGLGTNASHKPISKFLKDCYREFETDDIESDL